MQSTYSSGLVWLRRDLRLSDNAALAAAFVARDMKKNVIGSSFTKFHLDSLVGNPGLVLIISGLLKIEKRRTEAGACNGLFVGSLVKFC